jgi:drug/metabolite transporter (DMT)-like permease
VAPVDGAVDAPVDGAVDAPVDGAVDAPVLRLAPASSPGERRLAELGALLVVFLWAGNFVVSKSAIEGLPPVAYAALRFSLASVVLVVLLRWREGVLLPPRRDLPAMIGLGVLGFGIYQILWVTALGSISAGDSSLLIASTPVLVALLAVAAGSDVLTPAKLSGALVSFLGVAIVVGADTGLDLGRSLGGDILTLLAALCWATYTAFGANVLRRHSPLATTTWTIVAGTVVLLPVGAAQLAGIADPMAAVVVAVPAILYSGILSAGLPNVAVFHAVRLLGPTRVSAFQFLTPAIALVLAAVFLGEAVRPGQIAGGVVIVAGVLLTRRESFLPRNLRRRSVPGTVRP